MSKYFVFITSDKYPNADAGSVRTESFAQICKSIGYTPIVIGIGEYTGFCYKMHNDIAYCSLRLKWKNVIARILGRVLFPFLAIKKIKNINPTEIAGMMSVAGDASLLRYLKNYSRKNGIPVLFDCVEWYSPTEFANGEKNYFYKKNDNLNRKLLSSPLKIVSISRYLENYFNSKGLSTIRIPVILDVANISYSINNTDQSVIKIVYAGTPGNKDRLKEFVEAVSQLDSEAQRRLKVRIIGIDKQTFIDKYWMDTNNSISNSVVFEGRHSRTYVLDALSDADFAFLLRPSEERYAKAGFPTKVAESCSCATAMICNFTSDLDLYLKDGENSVIVSDCSVEACLSALRRIVELDVDSITNMKQNARVAAEKYFSREKYIDDFESFLQDNS